MSMIKETQIIEILLKILKMSCIIIYFLLVIAITFFIDFYGLYRKISISANTYLFTLLSIFIVSLVYFWFLNHDALGDFIALSIPEQNWTDKTQCRYLDEQGQIQNPTSADCPKAVSAITAITIAHSQGQKLYTIDSSNAATALSKLPVTGAVGNEIRVAIQSGMEITVHEKPITESGWTGYGYIITDPDTGGGGYLIEGGGNGAVAYSYGVIVGGLITLAMVGKTLTPAVLMTIAPYIVVTLAAMLAFLTVLAAGSNEAEKNHMFKCFLSGMTMPVLDSVVTK